MGKFATNAIGAIWWSNWNQCASGSPVAKLATVACGAIWWPNLQEVSLKSISNYYSWEIYSSYGLNTLGPLCLWQCFIVHPGIHKDLNLSSLSFERILLWSSYDARTIGMGLIRNSMHGHKINSVCHPTKLKQIETFLLALPRPKRNNEKDQWLTRCSLPCPCPFKLISNLSKI